MLFTTARYFLDCQDIQRWSLSEFNGQVKRKLQSYNSLLQSLDKRGIYCKIEHMFDKFIWCISHEFSKTKLRISP